MVVIITGISVSRLIRIKEIILAVRIENVYSKEDILLLYLNSVPFGEDVFGVESAARRYFNKPASIAEGRRIGRAYRFIESQHPF